MRKLLFAASMMLVSACGKEDQQKCDSACRNYATLLYWEEADLALAKVAPADLEAAKLKKVSEFAGKLELGLDFCVSKCQAANNDEQTVCLIKAKSAAEVKACTADD